jgi:hypothetical protein
LGLLPNRRTRANSFDRADPGVAGTNLNVRKVIEIKRERQAFSPFVLLRSFDGLPVLSEVASSLFGVVILSASRPRETGVALDFGWPLVDSSRDGLRVPFGEAAAVALAGSVAIADAVAVGEAAALGCFHMR